VRAQLACARCNFTGYRGRTGIHELLPIDDRVRAAIHRGENEIMLDQGDLIFAAVDGGADAVVDRQQLVNAGASAIAAFTSCCRSTTASAPPSTAAKMRSP
jgi:type II secretory ATPase GspE/PulE/Tfp pilus assembly ATPase PilB-like protein